MDQKGVRELSQQKTDFKVNVQLKIGQKINL